MQLEFFDVPSPCIGVCQVDDRGYCLGCMRTREERLSWLNLSCADRQKVIKRCRQRKKRRDNANKPKVPAEEVVIVQHSLLEPPVNPDSYKPAPEQKPELGPAPETKAREEKKQAEDNNQLAIENDMDFSDFEL
ncbi:DUF1289 domain-containing protein [Thalassomonas viridans]|uniref:DUF1289 domain-containing protein n=1 Tax=Thalassomonas viridans TaxID=137584 RepID=A0AAE9Z084_9GAMM|nr:DUF1289 domain-containing protein [Thalassomonas viridans]